MKSMKRVLSLLMAGLLAITPVQVNASEIGEISGDDAVSVTMDVSDNGVDTLETESEEDMEDATDLIIYNTGNHEYSVASSESQNADAVFEEDGSYTISIPEEDPFFPYEVQFKNGEDVVYEWFMSPDDSVQVGGHTFYVNADFTGTVMTQMALNIAGSTVIVYPEEKEYSNEPVLDTESLLPLKKTTFDLDLKNFSPMDLKKVSVSYIFAGHESLNASDKVSWTYEASERSDTENRTSPMEYKTTNADGYLDLSWPAFFTYSTTVGWTMILSDNQLDASAMKYVINCEYTSGGKDNWLVPVAYLQRSDGSRNEITPAEKRGIESSLDLEQYGYGTSSFTQTLYADGGVVDALEAVLVQDKDARICWGLKIDEKFAGKNKYASLKAYNGYYTDCQEAVQALDVTNEIFASNMTQKGAGYKTASAIGYVSITLVSFDAAGNPVACLPVSLHLSQVGTQTKDDHSYVLSTSELEVSTEGGYIVSCGSSYHVVSYDQDTDVENLKIGLYQDTPTYYDYMLKLYSTGYNNYDKIEAIYLGHFNSAAEASAAGAADLKPEFMGDGYKANYSGGLPFTFVTTDGKIQKVNISVYEADVTRGSGNTGVTFYGFKDKDGNIIRAYRLPNSSYDDDYADNSYMTYLVASDVDTAHLKPLFTCENGINLYSSDGTGLEQSGITEHDFSQDAVAYTSSAENKINQQNFWLKVIKVAEGNQALYVSNFANKEATQYYGDGIVRGTREIVSFSYHDIFVINYGTNAIDNISVELDCEALTLDDYWTYNGKYSLAGANPDTFGTVTETQREDGTYSYSYSTSSERPANISKLRLRRNPNYSGDINGTLRIKSGDKTLVELKLTGTTESATITTDSIRTAVKYVPYGMMIQNNNKYKSSKIYYKLYNGKLPNGVVLKPNGELYGIPLESGEFEFTVDMLQSDNSNSRYYVDEKTYTWTVLDNTDQYVDNQNDTGYAPTEKVPYTLGDSNLQGEYLYVSPGTYDQFIDVYLDGQKLVQGIDYTSKSGSTRITIKGQTLASKGDGTHTIGVEFRTETKTGELKASAQNYIYNNASVFPASPSDKTESSDASQVNNTSNTPSAPANNNAVVAISTTYTVKSGDTLWKIAEKLYGNGALWTKIYADNKAAIKNPDRIYVGQVLMIYPVVGDGTFITASDGKGTYTVQSGDTLWKIAKKKYGRHSKWRKIYGANKSTLTDPNKLRVGQVIVLPD